MRVLFCAAIAATLSFALSAQSDEGEDRVLRVAVFDLQAETTNERLASIVTEALLFELRKLKRVSAIGTSEIRTMLELEATKEAIGCNEDSSCLAEIADALGVDFLVTGTLAAVGDQHIFSLTSLNQETASAAHSFTKRMPQGDGTEFLAEIGTAVQTLFPDRELRVGVTRGVSEEVAQSLNPPPLPVAVFWTGVATTSALLVGAVVAGGFQLSNQARFNELAERSKQEVVAASQVTDVARATTASEFTGWTLLGGAALVGTFTAIITPLCDFHGYGNDE